MPDLADTPTTAFSPATLVRGTVPGGDPAAPAAAGDVAGVSVLNDPTTFTLYRHGDLTVIGWAGAEEIDADPAEFQREAADLVKGADASVLAIDLGGLERYPPGLLGGLSSLVRRGVRVLLFDPTEDVRDVLRVSHLDHLLGVHRSDVAGPAATE